MKRFMTVSIFALIMMFILGTNVGATSAEENIGVSDNPPAGAETDDGVSTQGLGKPTESYNIKNSSMPFAGVANASDLFTNKYFTGSSSVSIEVHNHHSKTLKYKLYKKGKFTAVETFTLKPGKSQISARSLDSKGKYYIKFFAPSNFSGSVSG